MRISLAGFLQVVFLEYYRYTPPAWTLGGFWRIATLFQQHQSGFLQPNFLGSTTATKALPTDAESLQAKQEMRGLRAAMSFAQVTVGRMNTIRGERTFAKML